MNTNHLDWRYMASKFAESLTNLVGVKLTDRVVIFGCEHIELLVELAARGFVEITCRAPIGGPNTEDGAADLVVVPALRTEAMLLGILSRLNRNGRPDAMLVIGIVGSKISAWQQRLPQTLANHGFALVRAPLQTGDLSILCARRFPTWQAQAA
jgi:hypothetical protein